MQGGKNWILPKEIKMQSVSETLIGWKLEKQHMSLRRYDMNGRLHMQGGKNWNLPKEMNANRFFWGFHWLGI
jgi:hypothetical protein